MSGELVAALNTGLCRAIRSFDGHRYIWPCGLFIAASNNDQPLNASILRCPAVLQAAHKLHHGHKGKNASLYMKGGRTPTGIQTLADAWCSCVHKDEV